MNETKPSIYAPHQKIIFNCTEQKNYLLHYGILKLYVKQGMIVDKVQEIISFSQCIWLEK